MKNDNLSKRMKDFYESVAKTKLLKKVPVAIRIDGRAFHNFTKGFDKPFDEILMASMQKTMKYLCENIQGCVLGYTQSDEITLILIDYINQDSSAWFGYDVQKLCSISASMATMVFNDYFGETVNERYNFMTSETGAQIYQGTIEEFDAKFDNYFSKIGKAMFDSRCFNVPIGEVTNLILDRQNDATNNSIQSLGQAEFSHEELKGKSCNEIQDMLMLYHGINWNDLPIHKKRGSCCIKADINGKNQWIIDNHIPIFKGEGRKYIEKLIKSGDTHE